MKQLEPLISIRAYAKSKNIDEKAVRKAIDEGKIKKGYVKTKKKIKASIADKEWGHLHDVIKPQRGVSKAKAAEKMEQQKQPVKNEKKQDKSADKSKIPDDSSDDLIENYSIEELIKSISIYPELTYSEALRRKEILGIAGERMKLEEQQGLLVRKADVEKALFAVGDMLKKDLNSIPARCIDDIMAAPNKVEATNILVIELQTVLKKFSSKLPT